jgi:2-C-methyl-D-erythritol 4-phosphate cytidylyltransferase
VTRPDALVVAILVAAGRGERLAAGVPKAFVPLGGHPLLVHAFRALARVQAVDEVVVVVGQERRDQALLALSGEAKLGPVVAGGPTRQASVAAGLAVVDAAAEVVLVHDAARPFVGCEVVQAVVAAAREAGAAVPVMPVADTVKRLRDGRVAETLDRSGLALAQTPQGFRAALLRRAYAACAAEGVEVTDEAMAVERLGEPVAAVPGNPANAKITTPEDLAWARRRLAEDEG